MPSSCYVGIEMPDNPILPPVVDPHILANILPHGAGIDGTWHIQAFRNGNLRITGEYHVMNNHGYYTHWERFSFRLSRAKKDKLHPLKGPCEGQFQVLYRKGDILMTDVRGLSKRQRELDLQGYLFDTVYHSLYQADIKVH